MWWQDSANSLAHSERNVRAPVRERPDVLDGCLRACASCPTCSTNCDDSVLAPSCARLLGGQRRDLLVAVGATGHANVIQSSIQEPEDGGVRVSPTGPGAVYEFYRGASGWVQRRRLQPAAPTGEVSYGFGVAISGATIAIGAHLDDSALGGDSADPLNPSAPNSGAVYVYR